MKLKKTLFGVMIGVIISVILYCMVAFIAWDFNAENWGADVRGLAAFLCLCSIGGGIGFSYLE